MHARDGLAPNDILEPEDIALVLELITTYWIEYIKDSCRDGAGWVGMHFIWYIVLNINCASTTYTM